MVSNILTGQIGRERGKWDLFHTVIKLLKYIVINIHLNELLNFFEFFFFFFKIFFLVENCLTI